MDVTINYFGHNIFLIKDIQFNLKHYSGQNDLFIVKSINRIIKNCPEISIENFLMFFFKTLSAWNIVKFSY